MSTIVIALIFLARSDVAYPNGDTRQRLNCVELHLTDPLGRDTPRLTLNFSLEGGGDPVQWHLWPFGHIEQEELRYNAKRYVFPPQ